MASKFTQGIESDTYNRSGGRCRGWGFSPPIRTSHCGELTGANSFVAPCRLLRLNASASGSTCLQKIHIGAVETGEWRHYIDKTAQQLKRSINQ
uniref:Uncharacterized protein n=1 Tax=Oryza sativa subsp. japonica TaxID=39947 RepID=Q75HP1_ORYSJ|nr:hypothetical protein LOC_Os03g41270 [Oryza sativa Japonica Group]